MHKILFDIQKHKVVDYDIPKNFFQFELNIPSLDIRKTLSKTVMVPKKNKSGELLYSAKVGLMEYEITENQIEELDAKQLFETVTINEELRFENNPKSFTLEDIINAKQQQLLDGTEYQKCILYETEFYNIVDLQYQQRGADTGYKLINLHPSGSIKINPINLEYPVKKVRMYIESTGTPTVKYSIDEGLNYTSVTYTDKTYIVMENENDFDSVIIIIEDLTNIGISISSIAICY